MRKSGNTFAPGSSLFTPSVIRGLTGDQSALVNVTAASLSGSTQNTTSSFRYDPPGSPLKSTQQISVDWSKFENHTFFNSAEAKVNTSFDIIINTYPFDGSRSELLSFFDGLTGFEKYVYDLFPKSRGFLHFSGSTGIQPGSYIKIIDSAGTSAPSISRNTSAKSILDQGEGSITYDFHLHIPTGTSQGNQVVIQRLRDSNFGITLALSQTLSTDHSGTLLMLVSSGSSFVSASMPVSKGDFQHICATYDTSPGVNRVKLYRNSVLQSASTPLELGSFGYTASPFYIGSGSNHRAGTFGSASPGITFNQTLSGAIDELRVYHSIRSSSEQKKFSQRSVFPDSGLKLYYKFNEPTGSYSTNATVIDSSGNSLHSSIVNFNQTLRERRGLTVPVSYESEEESPVLFPSHPDVVTLNENLLSSASDYDTNNPNMITKLIPRHYLMEASIFEGFGQNSELGNITDPYSYNSNLPGGGKLGSAQIIASLLFIWAKYFDELKMHLDQFGKQRNVDQIEEGTIANTFLPYLAETYGFQLPEMFPNSSYEQFYNKTAVNTDSSITSNSLQFVQNQIWRRVLSDMVEILRSKGTVHSIKSLIRDMGINPDSNFRFREFGGSRTGRLSDQRVVKTSNLRSLDFSGSFSTNIPSYDSQGVPTNFPYFKSSGLVQGGPLKFSDASVVVRKEPGYPYPGALPVYDRILTSGSWTYEATYKMTSSRLLGVDHPLTSSLVRFETSGTNYVPTHLDNTFLNLLAFSGSVEDNLTGSLSLIFRDTWSKTDAPKLVLPLTGVNIFDGDFWQISFGRERNDSFNSIATSSWYLRAGKQIGGRLVEFYENSILFDDTVPPTSLTGSILTTWSNQINMSGTMIHIGTQQVPKGSNLLGLSYNGSPNTDMDRSSFFGGRVLNMRFWSKSMTLDETKAHVLNPTSLGVTDAKKNFNFVNSLSGSWEKLRLDVDFMQENVTSDGQGSISLVDMSQNGLACNSSGFESNSTVFRPEIVTYSTINPNFDQSSDPNKIRVRSWQSNKNVELYGGQLAPMYQIPEDEDPTDDTRFSIEINAVQALNEDIIKIFSSLDSFDNYIGRPELQFSDDYPDFQSLRDVYFNRLVGKVNFSTFFEFFKWFDTTVSQIIEGLIPRKTKFLGVNFVIESHMLERPKVRYNTHDIYVGPNDRHGSLGLLLVQQLVGDIKRY